MEPLATRQGGWKETAFHPASHCRVLSTHFLLLVFPTRQSGLGLCQSCFFPPQRRHVGTVVRPVLTYEDLWAVSTQTWNSVNINIVIAEKHGQTKKCVDIWQHRNVWLILCVCDVRGVLTVCQLSVLRIHIQVKWCSITMCKLLLMCMYCILKCANISEMCVVVLVRKGMQHLFFSIDMQRVYVHECILD
jgi:hypothetical protein